MGLLNRPGLTLRLCPFQLEGPPSLGLPPARGAGVHTGVPGRGRLGLPSSSSVGAKAVAGTQAAFPCMLALVAVLVTRMMTSVACQ
jgi:hypothetical protein